MPRSIMFVIVVLFWASVGTCESVWVSHVMGAELYETHSTDSEPLAELPFGTELRIIEEYHQPDTYDLWYMVAAEKTTGWLPAGYVEGRPPGGYRDSSLVAASTDIYGLMVSGEEQHDVAISSPLTVAYSSSDRFNGTGVGSTSVDAFHELEGGVRIPVMYDGQGWYREEPATEPYGDTVGVDILGRLRHAEANIYDRFEAPIFDLHSDSLSCLISTGSHWFVILFFRGEGEGQLELVKLRYTTIDPG